MDADAGGEAVEVDPDALELRQQLLESSLVGHASPRRAFAATPTPRFRDDGAWLTC
jgi:hypothetical protein